MGGKSSGGGAPQGALPALEQIPPSSSGITWVHKDGRSPEYFLPEPPEGGRGFIDYDNDGWIDLCFVNSGKCDFFDPDPRLESPQLTAILDAFGEVASKERILRALSWLRKGIIDVNSVDESISYWTGLEVMQGPLRDSLRFRVQSPGARDAIQTIFEDELGFPDFQKVTNARNELLHGFRELSQDFIHEIQSNAVPIRKTLTAGIAHLLGVETSIAKSLVDREPRRIRLEPWQVLSGKVERRTEDFDGLLSNYPAVTLVGTQKKYPIDEEGNLAMTATTTYRFSGPPQANWKREKIEQWGDKEAGINGMRFDSIG